MELSAGSNSTFLGPAAGRELCRAEGAHPRWAKKENWSLDWTPGCIAVIPMSSVVGISIALAWQLLVLAGVTVTAYQHGTLRLAICLAYLGSADMVMNSVVRYEKKYDGALGK